MGRLLGSKTKKQRYALSFRNFDDTYTELGTYATMREIADYLQCTNQTVWNFIDGRIQHGARKTAQYRITRLNKDIDTKSNLEDLIEMLE